MLRKTRSDGEINFAIAQNRALISRMTSAEYRNPEQLDEAGPNSFVRQNERVIDVGYGCALRVIVGPTITTTSESRLRLRVAWGNAHITVPGAKGMPIDKYVGEGVTYYLDAGVDYSYVPTEGTFAVLEQIVDDSFVIPDNPGPADRVA